MFAAVGTTALPKVLSQLPARTRNLPLPLRERIEVRVIFPTIETTAISKSYNATVDGRRLTQTKKEKRPVRSPGLHDKIEILPQIYTDKHGLPPNTF
jgi:hypothetical protein